MKIDLNGRFHSTITKITDLVLLNLLYWICCIPIVTVGAATAALYYVTLRLWDNRESYLARDFFRSFKENFRQATLIWLLFLGLGVFLFLDFRITLLYHTGILRAMFYALMFLALLYFCTFLYVFPVLSKFYNSVRHTVKNAFLMSLRHLPCTLVMLAISLLPFLTLLLPFSAFLRGLPLLILFGSSLPAFLNSYFFKGIFRKYIPEDES